jgi:hypothetical protein
MRIRRIGTGLLAKHRPDLLSPFPSQAALQALEPVILSRVGVRSPLHFCRASALRVLS